MPSFQHRGTANSNPESTKRDLMDYQRCFSQGFGLASSESHAVGEPFVRKETLTARVTGGNEHGRRISIAPGRFQAGSALEPP